MGSRASLARCNEVVGTVREAFPGRMFSGRMFSINNEVSTKVSAVPVVAPVALLVSSAALAELGALLVFLLSVKSITGTTAFGEGRPLVPKVLKQKIYI